MMMPMRRAAFTAPIAIAITLCLAVGATADPLSSTTVAGRRTYRAHIERLAKPTRKLMTGRSWHAGCPVPLHDLRLIKLTYWGFDRAPHTGKLVVHKRWARGRCALVPQAVRRTLPDPPDAARRPVRRRRHAIDEGGQHLGVQLPLSQQRLLHLVTARVRTRHRHRSRREPVRRSVGCLTPEREAVRPSQAGATWDARLSRPCLVGVPRDRLALGRIVVLAHRLPALLGYEPLSALTQAAVRNGFGSTAAPSPGCHSMWSCGPLASPVDPT